MAQFSENQTVYTWKDFIENSPEIASIENDKKIVFSVIGVTFGLVIILIGFACKYSCKNWKQIQEVSAEEPIDPPPNYCEEENPPTYR